MVKTITEHDLVDEIIDRHHAEPSSLIQVLLEIQSEAHWLPQEALARVGERLEVPATRIQHIATFYKAFSLVPKGRHRVHICVGTACHVRGAPMLVDEFERILEIKAGETTEDKAFTVETVNCVGACALGPLVIVDGEYHGNLPSTRVKNLVKKIRKADAKKD